MIGKLVLGPFLLFGGASQHPQPPAEPIGWLASVAALVVILVCIAVAVWVVAGEDSWR